VESSEYDDVGARRSGKGNIKGDTSKARDALCAVDVAMDHVVDTRATGMYF
tara:strand:- start:477 stop:629 length:153 start_codon:yes stop_codon:yes gene_type:complete